MVATGIDEEGDCLSAVPATAEKASSDRGLRVEWASVQAVGPEGDVRDCFLPVWSAVPREGGRVFGGGDRVHAETDPAEGGGGETLWVAEKCDGRRFD